MLTPKAPIEYTFFIMVRQSGAWSPLSNSNWVTDDLSIFKIRAPGAAYPSWDSVPTWYVSPLSVYSYDTAKTSALFKA